MKFNKSKKVMSVIFMISLLSSFIIIHHDVYGEENKWSGVDESVVEKYAKDHGRESMEPLINTDQGDLLLFVFLLAGVLGGFIGGYYWRVLIAEKPVKMNKQNIIS